MGYRANTFEGQPHATTMTPANSARGSGEAFETFALSGTATVTYDTSTSAHGATSMKITVPAASSVNVRWEGLTRTTDQYARAYFRFPSLPGGTVTFVQNTILFVSHVAFIRVDPTGRIIVSDDSGGNAGTSTVTVTAGQWFRLEWHVSSGAQAQVRIFLSPDSTTPSETITAAAATNGSPDCVQFMCGDTFTHYVDCAMADSDGWPGPWNPRQLGMQIGAHHPYLIHEDFFSVTAAHPQRFFEVCKAYDLNLCRTFCATDQIFTAWLSNPSAVMADMETMLDDADAQDVKLILSPILNLNSINVLGGTTYASDNAAAVALTTSGSAPWNQLQAWQASLAAAVGGHNGLYSIEVGNEITWLTDWVSLATYLTFLDTFQGHLRSNGCKATNGPGGKVISNYNSLTDPQVLTYTNNLDYLDNHQYPSDYITASDAEAVGYVTAFETFVARARSLTSKPGFPVIFGEVGARPVNWFRAIANRIVLDEYAASFWVFDDGASDPFTFTDLGTNPDVLPFLSDGTIIDPPALVGAGMARFGARRGG